MLQGCLVTLCVDSSLHLWQLNVRDGVSFIEEVKYLSAETRSGLTVVLSLCANVSHLNDYCNIIIKRRAWFEKYYSNDAKDGTNIFVGTDSGNVHQVDVSSVCKTLWCEVS